MDLYDFIMNDKKLYNGSKNVLSLLLKNTGVPKDQATKGDLEQVIKNSILLMVDNILFERFPWKPAWHTYAKALIKDAANKWARMGNTPIELPTPLELSRDIIKYTDYPLANSL